MWHPIRPIEALFPAVSKRWLYLLLLIPLATTLLEQGSWTSSMRASLTDLTMTVLLALTVRMVNRQAAALQQAALTDPLTGLFNRRAFEHDLSEELARSRRLGTALSLIYADLDEFKQTNDRFGHRAGDRLLCRTGAVLVQVARRQVDRCYRLGGDEFAVLCIGTELSTADMLAQQIQAQVAGDADRPWLGASGLSSGVAQLGPGDSAEDLLRHADQTMYEDKAARAADRARLSPRRAATTADAQAHATRPFDRALYQTDRRHNES